MAARSRATRSRGKRAGRKASPLQRLESQLPPTLREFAGELRKRLDRLEREAVKAQLEARRRASKLLREASHQLGRLEVGGEAGWRKLGASYQKELLRLLAGLEKALAPPAPKPRPARKKAAAQSAAVVAEAVAGE